MCVVNIACQGKGLKYFHFADWFISFHAMRPCFQVIPIVYPPSKKIVILASPDLANLGG